jgi:hypothetical protein
MRRSRLAAAALALTAIVVACGGSLKSKDAGAGAMGSSSGGASSGSRGASSGGASSSGSGSSGAGAPLGSGPSGTLIHQQAVDKVDLLFMIDNSARMGDKQVLLARAVPDLINRLVTPNCVDANGNAVGPSTANGCTMAGTKLEFFPVHDMHIGIVTSSLGGRGGNQCPADATNEVNMHLSAHNDDQGHLINRGGDNETPVTSAQPFNFLSWFPPVGANRMTSQTRSPPTGPETTVGDAMTPGTLIGDFTAMIRGVHEQGCGFEAQNEAWYRFLVQPDPFDGSPNPGGGIQINNNRAQEVGLDATILRQRASFLRPDSLLAVIVVTDENEEVANPLSVGGEGWLYESAPFPSSPTYGAPEGTIECQGNPNDPNCTSCAFSNVMMAPNFATECPNDPPGGMQGFLDPSNDSVNVRFFNQKQRFGVFSGYPISRYVRGLQKRSVPDRAHEVDGNGNYVGDQDKFANCINPIFAQALPSDPNADLCKLQLGPRTPDLVYYGAIAGVPHQLLQAQSGVDAECPAGTPQADCPQKHQLTEADWLSITGKDPDHWDFSGADPHMIESENPRAGLQCNANSNDNCDPINGREWSTNKKDLQFACIFPLTDSAGQPAPKDCTQMQYSGVCNCEPGSNSQNTPLCQKVNGAYTNTQIYSVAYPSIREMAIAHAMADSPSGVQGIVSSVCPIHTSFQGGPTDPLFGYRPAANAIVDGFKNSLSVECLPQKLSTDSMTGKVSCLILVTLPKPGDNSVCSTVTGLQAVDPHVLQNFRAAQEAAWNQQGGANSGLPDPNTLPVCQVQELTPQLNPRDFDSLGCVNSADPGWCYVEGPAAEGCRQQILFTNGEPPPNATVNLVCH